MFPVALRSRSLLLRRVWPLLAGAVVVIAVMAVVGIGSAVRADRVRDLTAHLVGHASSAFRRLG